MFRKAFALVALFALPVAARAATPATTFDAGSVHVTQYGSGPRSLVLIPGLTDSGAVWDWTVARYQGSYTIYVLTLPGFGGRPPIAAPMLDTVDRDIAAFLPRANRPVVIGHSLGGFLAIRLAEERSDLIAGAIAIDGLPVFTGMDKLSPEVRAGIAASVAGRLGDVTPEEFTANARRELGDMTKPANVDLALSFSKGADPKATGEYMQELLSADIRPDLAKVKVPFLEIGPFDASLDSQNPYNPLPTLAAKQAYYQQLVANDPTAKVEMVADSRHFVMLDQPAALFALIDAFLASLH